MWPCGRLRRRCDNPLVGPAVNPPGTSWYPQDAMRVELDSLEGKGIEIFKMRSRDHELAKTVWTLQEAASRGLRVAVDTGQNLAGPAQTVSDVVRFVNTIHMRVSTALQAGLALVWSGMVHHGSC